MLRGKFVFALAALGILVLGFATEARAGDRPTREEMQAQMEKRMKDTIGVTDEAWKLLKPKVDKVQTLTRQVRGGGAMFGRRPANPDTPAPAQTDVEKKAADLQKLLQNKDSKPEDIAAALAACREAREKVKVELEKAKKDLLEGLTPRQEAGLFSLGIVD